MIEEVVVDCPYCGESFGTVVDGSFALEGDGEADYFEDCVVCCRPIRLLANFDAFGALLGLTALRDGD